MPRYIRNTAITAKIETTYGTDAAPSGAANAMLGVDLSIEPIKANMIDRGLYRGFMGNSELLVGAIDVSAKVSIELAGAGAAGSAPNWGPLARACGLAETVSAGNRVEYKPISTGFEAVSLYYYDDGVLHKLLGTRGEIGIDAKIGDRPRLTFDFMGLDGAISAASIPSLTLSGFQRPLPVLDTNTGDILLGCTYSTGTLSGGTAYSSQGLGFNMGNKVSHTLLLGGDGIDITDRAPGLTCNLEMTAAQEVAQYTAMKTPTLQAIGLTHGTTAGNIIVFFTPNAQIENLSKVDANGRRLIGHSYKLNPTTSGNDDFTLCVR